MAKKGAKKSVNKVKLAAGIIGAILFVVTVFCFFDNRTVKVVHYPEPSGYFFVEDYSGVLNEYTETYIYEEAAKLYHASSAQVVVITVPNTQDESLEDFSNHLANKWGIGDKDLDNGVLILFETDEEYPHVRLEVGKGLEGAITDGKAGRILDDYAVEDKENGRWNRAAANTFTATLQTVYEEYGMECPASVNFSDDWKDGEEVTEGTFADLPFPEPEYVENTDSLGAQILDAFLAALILVFIFFGVVVFIILIIIFGPSGGSGGGHSGGSFSGGGGGGGYHGGGGSFGGGGASR